jgi:hypothetical protein
MICVNANHTIVEVPNAAALTPLYDQGDTDDKPKPVPNINRISEREATAVAPAKIAPHETAFAWACRISGRVSDMTRSYSNESLLDIVDVFMKYLQTIEGGKISLRFGAIRVFAYAFWVAISLLIFIGFTPHYPNAKA